MTETITVSQAIAQGYTKCLKDGYDSVDDIGGFDEQELIDETYWVCEKKPAPIERKGELLIVWYTIDLQLVPDVGFVPADDDEPYTTAIPVDDFVDRVEHGTN